MKTIFFALVSLCVAPAAFAGEDLLPLDEFGKAFLKEHFKTEKAAEVPIDKVHDLQCVHVTLGTFDIAYPIWSLGEKGHVEDLQKIATALVQVQQHWIDWLAKGDPATVAPKADADVLLAWIKTWKAGSFGRADTAADKDLFTLLGARDAEKDASKRLGDFIGKPDVLGVAPKDGVITHLMFAPTRRDFIEMLGYGGMLEPERQPELWVKKAPTWTSFWIGWTFVIALEYPPWGDPGKDFKLGLSMNKFEPTGMIEHTVQQTMLTFLWMVYGDSDAIFLNQAMAMNMAIEICGELNALEGDGGRGTTGAQTNAYEKFVPGGNSAGGVLPPVSAAPYDLMKQNLWHENLGRDHFVGPLRKGQKLGQKMIPKDAPAGLDPVMFKDKNAHFQIMSIDGAKKYVVTAPFMGAPSKIRTYPPPEFVTDFREFFRAYKCGFYYWLQTQGDKAGAEPSAAKYRELLREIGRRDSTKTLDDLVAKIYGTPLSSKSGEVDSLEWRFLDMLAKTK